MADGTQRQGILTAIRWIARIWGTAILAFVLFFLVTSLFGEWGEGLRDLREVVTFLMFPVSTVVGLSVAWKNEGLGGLITTAGMLVAFAMRPDLMHQLFFSVGILGPGVLYMVYGVLRRRDSGEGLAAERASG